MFCPARLPPSDCSVEASPLTWGSCSFFALVNSYLPRIQQEDGMEGDHAPKSPYPGLHPQGILSVSPVPSGSVASSMRRRDIC